MNNINELYDILGIRHQKNLVDLIEEKKALLNIKTNIHLAAILSINKDTLSRIIKNEDYKIDIVSLIKLANFLELDVDKVVSAYIANTTKEIIEEIEHSKKASFIANNFDLNGLEKINFIKDKSNIIDIEHRIVDFFGLKSIYDYKENFAYSLFSKSKLKSQDFMNEFWIKCAYNQFNRIQNNNDFSVERLEDMVTKIRPYTLNIDTGLLTIVRALFNIGITVIVQDYISKTAVFGASFFINNKPCIVLTNHYKRYDLLWFTLFHELAHIIFDLEELKSQKFHLSGMADLLLLNEERANRFAEEMLFNEDKLNYISSNINNYNLVKAYAERNYVHPSIIYGFYIKKNSNKEEHYKRYSKYLISSEQAIAPLKSNIWDYDKNVQLELEKILDKINA
ncbi:ImmA/IrrE family metallo-endopeptidase [Sphingobacterium sp. PCS056]|uniref:ImmA/IrrE family metallo-endopeptidase n=1 Tax=Sphingobacterium sp. PCS056 TaxID=2931400 RepID=UPI00200FDE07|nr:ImmA/IrrE family metallo-endopeptidase [Sphingobacterium sp. PCS056]UPZ35308.1 ImmA/IrrE family metallo-endopeptidase [Sphingobacterium sp. PCS056]